MSKRKEIRRSRENQKRKTRLLIAGGISIFAILLVAAITIPIIRANNAPIGTIIVPPLNPRPFADGLAMGDPNAPIVVEEYSDFQCPFCKKFSDELEPPIVKDFIETGKVLFKYIPFRVIGSESDAAASAAYCAAEQNKFWEYHDILFANHTGEQVGDFTDKRLLAFAEKIGLNYDEFRTCYTSEKYFKQLNDNMIEGTKAKVDGTPAIFVNGIKVDTVNVYQTISDLLAEQ